MKHAEVFLFGILLVLMLTTVGSTDNTTSSIETAISADSVPDFTFSYTEFGQIEIDNDTHFATLAGDNGWVGYGNSTHPYIIENYNITMDFGSCIEIDDVDSYFIIRNCLFASTSISGMGVDLDNVNHSRIEDSVFYTLDYGIYAEYTRNLIIDNCTMYHNYRGIYCAYSPEVEIAGCEIYENRDLGIIMTQACNFSEIHDNFLYSNGNSGFYAAYTYNSTLQNNTIYDNDYQSAGCGVVMYFVDFWDIADNHIFENNQDGIEVTYSDFVDIHDNVIRNNTQHGVLLYDSRNITIADNEIYQNRGEVGAINCGIEVSSCVDCEIINNDIYNNTVDGIYLYYSDYISVSENHVYNNSRHGIYLQNSENCILDSNEVHGNRGVIIIHIWGNCGIDIYKSNNTQIIANEVYNNTQDGIFISQSYFCLVEDNLLYENARYGLYGDISHNITVNGNTIYSNNEDGLRINNGNYWNITWNIVYDNFEYGIVLLNSDECLLWYNDIGWNELGNAIDTAIDSNYWNHSSIGNWWSNYNGTGSYIVLGGSGIDYHPTVCMNMTPAEPTGYEFTSTGHLMPWWSAALNPWKYVALRNGTEFATGDWPGTMFDISIDGFPVGVHNVTLVLYHISGHTISNQSIVEVEDTVGPTWEVEPMDQFREAGDPVRYEITAIDPSSISGYELIGNDSFEIDSTGMISNVTNMDFLDEYTFEVRAYDIYNNAISKTITITIRDTTAPLVTQSPPDIEFTEGAVGNDVIWTAYDFMLAGFEVYVDGVVQFDGALDSGNALVSISLDYLLAGQYNFTIVFYDISGNTISDTVWVVVNAVSTTTSGTTTDTLPTTEPLEPLLILTVSAGGLIIVVVVVVFYAKKRG